MIGIYFFYLSEYLIEQAEALWETTETIWYLLNFVGWTVSAPRLRIVVGSLLRIVVVSRGGHSWKSTACISFHLQES